jgi:glucose/mannose transport system permease protein
MALSQTTHSQLASKVVRKGMRPERLQALFILLPSLLALFIFVYVFIATTFYISLSNWRTLKMDLSIRQPLLQTYADMFTMPRFHADIRNTFVFTIIFVIFATLLGLFLAILLDHKIAGKFIFRNIFLFPYALSFVVTGVAWRWIFNPETGINLFFNILGINAALQSAGLEPLKPGWITDPTVLWPVNNFLASIIPEAAVIQTKLGIPVALIPVAIAATS